MAVRVMQPGASTTYHWETEQEDTQDGSIAYARLPPSRRTRYPEGLLPG